MDQDLMKKLAQMQTDIRNLTQDKKKANQMLRDRDEEISKMKLDMQSLKDENLFLSHKIKVEERKKKDDDKKDDRRKK
jgi:hypothetical protein